MRREEEYVGKVMRVDVDGRRRGRLKWRWMDSVKVDLREMGLSGEETHNRALSRKLVGYIDPHRSGKRCCGRRS